MSAPIVVVKVGGSLHDLPDLARRLQAWLHQAWWQQHEPHATVIVPGGGRLTDAIRDLDRIHRIGEEASHWLALAALSVNARFLARLLPGLQVLPQLPQEGEGPGPFILDPLPFFERDEQRPGALPHLWQVTSDSLAVRVAICASAAELVLLKSVSWDGGGDWSYAVRAGIVDRFFERALQQAAGLRVHVVNLRETSEVSQDFGNLGSARRGETESTPG